MAKQSCDIKTPDKKHQSYWWLIINVVSISLHISTLHTSESNCQALISYFLRIKQFSVFFSGHMLWSYRSCCVRVCDSLLSDYRQNTTHRYSYINQTNLNNKWTVHILTWSFSFCSSTIIQEAPLMTGWHF